MEVLVKLSQELWSILVILASAVPYIAGYIGLILLTLFVWRVVKRLLTPKQDFGSLKTVTFGDESAVSSNFAASIVSIVLILIFWGSFTGSKILPAFLHMPGAFQGETEFTYTAETDSGLRDDATVQVIVHGIGEDVKLPEIDLGDGVAKNDVMAVKAYRTTVSYTHLTLPTIYSV